MLTEIVLMTNYYILTTMFTLIGLSYNVIESKLKKHEWKNRTNESNPHPYINNQPL